MVIVRLAGGLGNQMFQYATGLALAMRHDAELRFDLDWFDAVHLHQGLELPRVFGLDLLVASSADRRSVLGWLAYPSLRRFFSRRALRNMRPSWLAVEPHYHYWKQFEHLPPDVYLDGYWQSERYFAPIRDEIRKRFHFVLPLDERSDELVHEMAVLDSVSLHVRRGDFVQDPQVRRVHGVDLTDYYRQAIEIMKREVVEPHFYIFSDDPGWVESNFDLAEPFTVVDHNRGVDSYRDMQLMSLCKHNILANSTFSWWGAWLNPNPGKLVIAPRQWFNEYPTDTRDLYCSGWIVL